MYKFCGNKGMKLTKFVDIGMEYAICIIGLWKMGAPDSGSITCVFCRMSFSVQVSIPSGSGVTIDHGLLPSTYTLAQFHFHWGSKDSAGSEHGLDSKFYPMEVHVGPY